MKAIPSGLETKPHLRMMMIEEWRGFRQCQIDWGPSHVSVGCCGTPGVGTYEPRGAHTAPANQQYLWLGDMEGTKA